MANKGRSERGMFGTINHYDEHGKKVGRSEPGLFGGYTNYDADGHRGGRSDLSLFGGYNHYDNHRRKAGHSDPGIFGSYHHNDSQAAMWQPACMALTIVRRFGRCVVSEDNTLAETLLGRAFIRTYYAISPTIVKWFGKAEWFKKMCQGVLDSMIQRLNDNGVEGTPYNDREW